MAHFDLYNKGTYVWSGSVNGNQVSDVIRECEKHYNCGPGWHVDIKYSDGSAEIHRW